MKYTFTQRVRRFRARFINLTAALLIASNGLVAASPLLFTQRAFAANETTLTYGFDGFKGKNSTVDDWTFDNIGAYPNTGGESAPSLQFNDNNSTDTGTATLHIPLNGNKEARSASFWYKGNPTGKELIGTFSVEQSADNSDYSSLFTQSSDFPTTGTTVTKDLASSTRYLKFSWLKEKGNIALDDVSVTIDSPAPAVTPSVTAQDFGAWDASDQGFKGITVGFKTENFTNIEAINVTLKKSDTDIVTNTASPALLNAINTGTSGLTQNGDLSSPFVVSGTLNDTWCAGVPCWLAGSHTWTAQDKPDEALITVTQAGEDYKAVASPFSEASTTFESLLSSTPPNISGFAFVGSPKYVRANNAGDESARILVSSQTTEARFFIDGNSTPIDGTLVGPSASTTEWWKLNTSLTPGQHTIKAQVKIDSNWYDVPGFGTAYSIDSPWAEYVIPQANQYLRPNDKVVRIKADDEFDQFKHMVTTINGAQYTINRSDCSDHGNYVLCDLQNLNLPESTYTAVTTTYTKANNRVDNLKSPSFTIDNTRPTLSGFVITNSASVYSDHINVKASASDNSGIKNVRFYVTMPRTNDGTCDGNGANMLSVLTTTSPYSATLDTSTLNGVYCLNAIAEDLAANHSLPISAIKVAIDNTAPELTVNSYSGTNTTPTITGTTDDKTDTVTVNGDAVIVSATPNSDGTYDWSYTPTTALALGTHTFDVVSTDLAGNTTEETATAEILAEVETPSNTPQPEQTTSTTSTGGQQDTPQVLGTATTASNNDGVEEESNQQGDVKGDKVTLATTGGADDGSARQIKQTGAFLGLGWWWLPVLAAIAGGSWFFARKRIGSNA